MPKLTPSFLVNFETNLQSIIVDSWARVAQNLIWDKFVKLRPAKTKREILTWLLETAKIYPEGNGGEKRFDDIVAMATEYEISDFGAGLVLRKNEIEDNAMAQTFNGVQVGALDYAAKWARDIGAASGYFPQEKWIAAIEAGFSTGLAYDGLSFFSKLHLRNPAGGVGGSGTYSNIIENVNLRPARGGSDSEQDVLLKGRANLGTALAHVRGQRFFNGVPRFLVPRALLVQTDMEEHANLLVKALQVGATDNRKALAPLEVYSTPELDTRPAGSYFIGVEDMMQDELGAFIHAERQPFSVSFYGPQTDSALARQKNFEWHNDGRSGQTYGHPYLFYACFPGAYP